LVPRVQSATMPAGLATQLKSLAVLLLLAVVM